MTAVQGGTPEEAAMRNMTDRLDISDVLPDIDTTGWSYESREKLKEYCKAIKWSSLDTRHDLKLSFPPSDYSKTNDPVSLTYESCYKAVGYYTSIINDIPELKNAFIEAMAEYGITEDNFEDFLRREWDIWAYMLSLPEMAELTREMPEYEDYNRGKYENRSLISAKRKIEHTSSGKILRKVSLDKGGARDENGDYSAYEIPDKNDVISAADDRIMAEQCLAALDKTDREILVRRINGETIASLAKAYGYKTAGGMQKRIERIKRQIAEKMAE